LTVAAEEGVDAAADGVVVAPEPEEPVAAELEPEVIVAAEPEPEEPVDVGAEESVIGMPMPRLVASRVTSPSYDMVADWLYLPRASLQNSAIPTPMMEIVSLNFWSMVDDWLTHCVQS